MIKSKHRSKSEHAQTMVEFAIVFPILLLLTYGLIEFGRMIFIYVSVTSAAREGARYGAAAGIIDGSTTTKYYMYCDGMRTAIRRGAILTQIPDSAIWVWYDRGPGTPPFPDGLNRCETGVSSYGQDLIELGDRVGVKLTVQYSPIIEFLGFDGFDIKAQSARTVLTDLEFNPP